MVAETLGLRAWVREGRVVGGDGWYKGQAVRGGWLLCGWPGVVGFVAGRRDPGSATGQVTPYTAAITYRFSGEPMSAEARFVNPLGFQVMRYRRDAEALAATTVPVAPAAVVPAPVAPAPVQPAPAAAVPAQ